MIYLILFNIFWSKIDWLVCIITDRNSCSFWMTFLGPLVYKPTSIYYWSGLFFIRRKEMLQILMCLFGPHGATEIDYTIDDEEIKVCWDCLKEVKWDKFK